MEPRPEKQTWLVAAWPGMGNVAVIAGGYLVHALEMKPLGEIPPEDYFDVEQVEVKNGVIAPPRLPKSVFYRWDDKATGRSLLVFLSEAQPSDRTYAYAQRVLEQAARLGAERVVTFASMASQLHPSSEPRVFGAVTHPDMLADLGPRGVEALEAGQVGGLNGVLLGAAAARGLPGLCLLGEIPYFAAGVPNPKAAIAVLKKFGEMCGMPIDPTELSEAAGAVDRALLDLLERMREQAKEGGETIPLPKEPTEEPEPEPAKAAGAEPALDAAATQRIERLFTEAQRDRSKGVRLKEELDRLGVFRRYENRFLDLFRKGG